MTSRSHDGPLPLELVEQVIAWAGLYAIAVSPALATRLQLISRSSRKLLLPIIYFLFVVDLSTSEKGKQSPSFAFFLHLLQYDTCPPRAHIRHIVFKGSDLTSLRLKNPDDYTKGLKPWPLLSIALPNVWHIASFIVRTNAIKSSAFFQRDPQNDVCWLMGWSFSILRTREAEQVVSIGPISSTRLLEQHYKVKRQSPNMRDIKTHDKSASASTLRVLLDWVSETELALEGQFRAVERVLDDVLEFTNTSIVLELRRNDEHQEKASMEFSSYVQKLKEAKWRDFGDEKLQLRWRLTHNSASVDEYAADVRNGRDCLVMGPSV